MHRVPLGRPPEYEEAVRLRTPRVYRPIFDTSLNPFAPIYPCAARVCGGPLVESGTISLEKVVFCFSTN